MVGYPGITEQEISDITRGPLRLGFVRINDSLFFLLKAGNNPWFDAPYEPRFKMNQLDYQTNIPEGKGAPMLICAVDTASGELKEMRVSHSATYSLNICINTVENWIKSGR